MATKKHIYHHGRGIGFSYPLSLQQRIYSMFIAPLAILIILLLLLRVLAIVPSLSFHALPLSYLWKALGATFVRLVVAYFFALFVSIPLALLITKSTFAEHLLLPVFDIIQSIPVLAFFPLIILFFIHYHFLNGAAIFIIFLSMLWNIVFSIVGGLKVIPNDIKWVAHVFNIRGFAFVREVLIPAVVPYIITGSLLAWAQGWNIIIVAEVLHTYIPGGSADQDLFGIGSVLVNAIARGEHSMFVAAIVVMVLGIAFLNLFVWQKLLHYAERFRFE